MATPADGVPARATQKALQALDWLWKRYRDGDDAPELGDELAAALVRFNETVGTLAVNDLGYEQYEVLSPHHDLHFNATSARGTSSLPQLAVDSGGGVCHRGAAGGGSARRRQRRGPGSPVTWVPVFSLCPRLLRPSPPSATSSFAHAAQAVLCRVGTSAAVSRVEAKQTRTTMNLPPPALCNPREWEAFSAACTSGPAPAPELLISAVRLEKQLRQPAVTAAVAAAVSTVSAAAGGGCPSPLALWRVLDRAARFTHNLLWGMWLDLTAPRLMSARQRVYESRGGGGAWPKPPPEVPQLLTLLETSGLLEGLAAAMLEAPAPSSQAAASEVTGLAIANMSHALLFLPFAVKQITEPADRNRRAPSPAGLQAVRLLLSPAVQRLQRCLLERYCLDAAARAAGAAATAAAAEAAAAAGAGGAGGSEAEEGSEAVRSGGIEGSADEGARGGIECGWAALDRCRLPQAELRGEIDLSEPLVWPQPEPHAGPTSGTTVHHPVLRTWEGMVAAADMAEYARVHHATDLMDDDRLAPLMHMAQTAEAALRLDAKGGVFGHGTPLAVLRRAEARGRVAAVLAEARWARTLEAVLRFSEGAQPVIRIGSGTRGAMVNTTGPGGERYVQYEMRSLEDVARLQAAWAQLGPGATPESVAALLGGGGGGGGRGGGGQESEAEGSLLLTLTVALALPPPAMALLPSPPPPAGASSPHAALHAAAPAAPSLELARDVSGLLASLAKVTRRVAATAMAEVAAGGGTRRATEQLGLLVQATAHLLGVHSLAGSAARGPGVADPPAEPDPETGTDAGGSSSPRPQALDAASPAAAEVRGAAALCLRGCVRAVTSVIQAAAARAAAASAAPASRRGSGSGARAGAAGAAQDMDARLYCTATAACAMLSSPLAGWGSVPQGLVPAAPERLIKAACEALPVLTSTPSGRGSTAGTTSLYLGAVLLRALLDLSAADALGAEVVAWLQPEDAAAGAQKPSGSGGGGGGGGGGGKVSSAGVQEAPMRAAAERVQAWGYGSLAVAFGGVGAALQAVLAESAGAHQSSTLWTITELASIAQQPPPPAWVSALVPPPEAREPGGGSLEWRLPKACCNPNCTILDGPREAELPLALCGGCRAVRYCLDKPCQKEAWKAGHKQVCAALAAERQARAAAPAGPQE
ncbi:hypothetical protein HYH03_000201 [Edaphochlamys debaryana]|uniref:MYND-type domain-containing protein n=1 Tax=Edaphochlamys debaryana TaxID=47281 RepID=A0A836C770_9CHLO|nr:hypothetical protein HYH03_000201 [Edaphochlamys debaryana]|eukprot:KAG2501699.1 hypothetical protein HYH03_000201 [Edaphochlamys debaryana]